MKKIIVLFALFAAMFFSGCNQNKVSINNQITDPNVIIENESIYNWLQLDKVNYFTRDDGLMEVEARFRNFSDSNKVLAYKINWMDKNGFIEKTILSRWTITQVEERRALIIHGIAPSMKIKSFEIRLQEPTKDDGLRKDSYHNEYQGN